MRRAPRRRRPGSRGARSTGPCAGRGSGAATRSTMPLVICIAVDPVPTTPTRAPSIATSWSQRELWKQAPAKSSRPSISGYRGWCRTPVAAMTTSASSRVPAEVSRCQRPSIARAARDLLAEADVVDHAVLAGDPLEVGQDLVARREGVAPVRVEGERVAVEVRRDVAGDARVGVLPPGAPEAIGLLVDDQIGQAGLPQLDGAEDPGHPRPDDHHPQVPLPRPHARSLAEQGGSPGHGPGHATCSAAAITAPRSRPDGASDPGKGPPKLVQVGLVALEGRRVVRGPSARRPDARGPPPAAPGRPVRGPRPGWPSDVGVSCTEYLLVGLPGQGRPGRAAGRPMATRHRSFVGHVRKVPAIRRSPSPVRPGPGSAVSRPDSR